MKWAVIGRNAIEARFVYLSTYLKTHGVENKLECFSPEDKDFVSKVEDLKKTFDQVRIEAPFCHRVVREASHLPSMIQTLQSADCYFHEKKQWWLRNLLYEAILQLAPRYFKEIDLSSPVLLIGSGAAATTMVAGLSNLGFKRFSLTDLYIERAQTLIAELKRRYFGLELTLVPNDSLTLLPGHFQIVINSTPFVPSNTLLEDLYYFNYMKNHGIVIDLTLKPVETRLLKEAVAVQARGISGHLIAATIDWLWLKKCQVSVAATGVSSGPEFEAYHKGLIEMLSQSEDQENDPT